MEAVIAGYLSKLTTRLESQLSERLVAAWLVGSGALGDFDPQRSDLDVQAVCTTRLARRELDGIAAVLSHEALPCPVRGLELVLYAREDLADPNGPAFQLNLNTGSGMEYHASYDPTVEPRFWFTLDVAIAREHARPLAGPSPGTILPVLPRALVLSAHRDSVAWYRAHAPEQALVTACRAAAWAADGRWLSKAEATRWMLDRVEQQLAADQGTITRPGSGRSSSGAWL